MFLASHIQAPQPSRPPSWRESYLVMLRGYSIPIPLPGSVIYFLLYENVIFLNKLQSDLSKYILCTHPARKYNFVVNRCHTWQFMKYSLLLKRKPLHIKGLCFLALEKILWSQKNVYLLGLVWFFGPHSVVLRTTSGLVLRGLVLRDIFKYKSIFIQNPGKGIRESARG